MLNRIAGFIAEKQLLDKRQKHIVALSGGADSVALLLILRELGYQVEAAHCNFRLRGKESERDEIFSRSLCSRLSVPFHLIHFETAFYAELHQVSIEMAARQLRYRYFEQLRQDIGAAEVCVAHHQDDAVETLLMNLIRGTGIHGLTGIRPRNGHIVRPLLCVSRADILRFLDERGQDYVTDSTNLVPDVVRNKLRLEVLPMLRQINPAVSANIAKTAERMSEVEKVFDASMKTAIDHLVVDGAVSISRLLEQPSPEYLLQEWLAPKGFTPSQVEQIFSHLEGPSGRVFQSATHEVAIDRGQIIIEACKPSLPIMRIPESGTYHYAAHFLFRFLLSDEVTISKQPNCATFDADAISFPLTIRPVQTGDRFQPFGMEGSRLVSDYLTDRKRSVFEKRRQLVLTDAKGHIIWLVGERISQRAAVKTTTQQLLKVEFSEKKA